MKTKFFWTLIAIVAMAVSGMALTSCGGDSKDEPTPSEPTAKTATAKATIYIAADMLDKFDVTATIDGKVVTLTAANTTKTTYQDEEVRTYTVTETYTTFPASQKVSVSAKFKSDFNAKTAEPSNYCLWVDESVSNDIDKWSTHNIQHHSFEFTGDLDWPNMSDTDLASFNNKTYSANTTFETAGKVTVTYTTNTY